MAVCVGPPDVIAMGSASVIIGNMPAARIGDMTAHGGVIVAGCPTVIKSGMWDGAGGGSGAAGTMKAAKQESGVRGDEVRLSSACSV